jgi:hypothetical protein
MLKYKNYQIQKWLNIPKYPGIYGKNKIKVKLIKEQI